MQYRMTSRRRKPRGNTAPQQGEKQERSPRMPHERDESADSQRADEVTQRARAAREDIERGVVDTDKGPVLDETYEKNFRGGDDPEKKLSP